MELTFVKNEKAGSYVAEFEVTADFNLHIEREKGGRILFYQKSQGAGGWAHIDDMGWQDGKPSIDYDFTALVYPKMIKIVSESEPTYAAVATDGEVTEIKSQSKEIEVTANGTTVVEPDAGFAYLNKVSVKTNVEGQGGGGSEGGSNYLYYDQKRTSLNTRTVWENAALLRVEVMGNVFIDSPSYFYKMFENAPEGFDLESSIVAVCLDLNLRIANPEFNGTIEEFLGNNVSYLRDESSITEEEFYTL